MKREIFEVYAKVVDSTGSYNTLSGYPKVFDSHQYNDDCEKAKARALAEYHDVLGAMYKRDDRQEQLAMIISANLGIVIEGTKIGAIADLPDPTYAVTVNDGSGSGNYIQGASVTIVADEPAEGKEFDAWGGAEGLQFINGSNINSATATFTMPAEAVEVTATYKDAE